MTKPDITLEPSKGVISEMASRIYAAYIMRGEVKNGEEASWMQRSIRAAVRIAKTVDASIETDDESDASENAATSDSPDRATPPGGTEIPANPKGAATESEFESIIDEALSSDDVRTRKRKG